MRDIYMANFYASASKNQKCSMLVMRILSEELQKISDEADPKGRAFFFLLPGQVIGGHYYYHPKLLASSVYKAMLTRIKKLFAKMHSDSELYISKDRYANILMPSDEVGFRIFLKLLEQESFFLEWYKFKCDLQMGVYFSKLKDKQHQFVMRLNHSTKTFSLTKLDDAYNAEDVFCQSPVLKSYYHYVLPVTFAKQGAALGLHSLQVDLVFKRLFGKAFFDEMAHQKMDIVYGKTACYEISVEQGGVSKIDTPAFFKKIVNGKLLEIVADHSALFKFGYLGNVVVYGNQLEMVSLLNLLRTKIAEIKGFSCSVIWVHQEKRYPDKKDYTHKFLGETFDTIWDTNLEKIVFQYCEKKLHMRLSLANVQEVESFSSQYKQNLSGLIFRVVIANIDGKGNFIVTNNLPLMKYATARVKAFVHEHSSVFNFTYDRFNRPYFILKQPMGLFHLSVFLRMHCSFSLEPYSDMERNWSLDARQHLLLYNQFKVFVKDCPVSMFRNFVSAPTPAPMSILADVKSPNVDGLFSFLFPPAQVTAKPQQQRKRKHSTAFPKGFGAGVKRMRPEHVTKHLLAYEHKDTEEMCYRFASRTDDVNQLQRSIEVLSSSGVTDYRIQVLKKELSDRQQGLSDKLPGLPEEVPLPSDILDKSITHPDYQQNVERLVAERYPLEWKRYKHYCEPYLEVRPSTIEGAGMGLFVVAKDHDVVIRNVYIPYFGIKRFSNDADSDTSNPRITHIIGYGTGGSVARGGYVIEHVSGDNRPQAYFANHMHRDGPFFALTEYPHNGRLKGIYIPAHPGLAVPKGQCVEIFTNYGKAARTHHGIVDDKANIPTQLFHSCEPEPVEEDVSMQLLC